MQATMSDHFCIRIAVILHLLRLALFYCRSLCVWFVSRLIIGNIADCTSYPRELSFSLSLFFWYVSDAIVLSPTQLYVYCVQEEKIKVILYVMSVNREMKKYVKKVNSTK